MRHGTVRGDGFLKHLLSVVAAALFSSLSLAAAPTFVTGGDAEWFQDADGSWRSGAVPVHGMTWIAETVTGPGTWTCEWRISSDKDCGYVSMWVDGVEEIFYDTGSPIILPGSRSCTLWAQGSTRLSYHTRSVTTRLQNTPNAHGSGTGNGRRDPLRLRGRPVTTSR